MHEAILNLLDDYIYISDVEDYEVLFLNTRLREALGIGDRDYTGQRCHKLLMGYDEPCPFCKNPVLTEDAFLEWEDRATMLGHVLQRRDKILVWQGRCCRLSIADDVTTRVQLQQQQQQHMLLALDAAQEASSARMRFLSGVSHELRTPLNAILGFINVANASAGQPHAVAEAHKKAEGAARHLLSMLNDILDVADMENGTFTLRPAPFEFADFLAELCSLFVLEGRQRQIHFHPSADFFPTETLFADALRLKQLLTALLSNAFKFSDMGDEVRLDVRPGNSGNETLWLEFDVTDTGRGVPPEFVHRMFEPFESDTKNTCVGEAGAGLGLPICKKIVDLMGGELGINSTPGKGTHCHVRIPAGVRPSRRDALTPEQYDQLRKLRLLVVDDATDCQHLKRILDSLGIQADMVHRGLHAVDLLQDMQRMHEHYDACIVHCKVYDLESSGLWENIARQQGVLPQNCAVSMLSYAEGCACMGTNDIPNFLCKPYMTTPVLDFLCKVSGTHLPPAIQADAQGHDFSHKRLLLVEDNELNREVAFELLSKVCKFSVEMAQDGRDGVTMFQERPPGYYDVILMDICMPVLDGHAAAREIRALAHMAGDTIPIVALSANCLDEDKARSRQSGMNDHVAKPLDLDVLCPVLARVLAPQSS